MQLVDPWRSVAVPDETAPMTPAEAELEAIAAAKVDPRAFAPIYERYAEPIYYFCYRRLGDPELASDVTSIVFMRALAALGSFRPRRSDAGSTVRAWLYMIARNVITDTHRRSRKHASLDHPEAPDLEDRATSPEDLALGAEEARLVNSLLADLPERQRAVVELRLAGLNLAEVAHTLGITVPAVKALQVRAYRDLRTLSLRSRAPDPGAIPMTRHDPLADSFNAWLEADLAGMSAPVTPPDDRSDAATLHRTARQFHGLARRAERFAARHASLPSSWEDLMNAHPLPAVAGQAPLSTTLRPAPVSLPRMRPVSRWQAITNAAMAAVLLIAIAAGLWRIGGGPGGDDGNHLAFAPGSTEDADTATPTALLPSDLPTAEDCKVEPLTVDEVLLYVTDPAKVGAGTPVASPSAREQDFFSGPATEEQLAVFAAVQREWMACVLADSLFQRWALESIGLVSWQVQAMLPTFPTEAEAQAILENAQETGVYRPHEDFWKRGGRGFQNIGSEAMPWGGIGGRDGPTVFPVALLDPNPDHSWTNNGFNYLVPYITYLPGDTTSNDGTWNASGTPTSQEMNIDSELWDTCMYFTFNWDADRKTAQISDIPSCG